MGLGGTDDSAQRLQLAENEETKRLIERQTQRASRDVQKLFGSSEQNILAGSEAARGLMGQYAPEQFSALQQGNLAAQQQLLAGMPQVQNALLGLPTNLSALQPRTFQPDLSFLQGKMPQFQESQQALGMNPQEQAQEQQMSAQAQIDALPNFTKRDFSVGGGAGMAQKKYELEKAMQGLSPEAYALLQQQGPSALGLGGNRGGTLFQQALGGGYDSRGQALPFAGINALKALGRLK